MIDEESVVTIGDCIAAAADSSLARPGEHASKEFYETLRIGAHDDGSDWHKVSAAGHLARAFFGMLQTAQDEGVSAKQIDLALRVELERHLKGKG